jgi:hypothetical protein
MSRHGAVHYGSWFGKGSLGSTDKGANETVLYEPVNFEGAGDGAKAEVTNPTG